MAKNEVFNDSKVVLKVLLIGDSGVGKTALVRRICKDVFDDAYIPTIGVDFDIYHKKLNSEINLEVLMWNISGAEVFQSIVDSHYQAADAIVIVYAVNNRKSYMGLQKWLDAASKYDCPNKFLICTKRDLVGEVTFKEGKDLAEKNGMKYYDVSAKENLFSAVVVIDTILEDTYTTKLSKQIED